MTRLTELLIYKSYWLRQLALYSLGPTKDPKPYLFRSDWLTRMKENGCIFIPGLFKYVADYALQAQGTDVLTDEERAVGTTKYMTLDLKDPMLMPLLNNFEVRSLLWHYYGRQPYFRGQPVVKTQTIEEGMPPNYQGRYHLDGGLHQVSFMLLLNDIGLGDTHMEYALKSHKKDHKTLDRRQIDERQVERDYWVDPLIGKKGDLYIFDAGNGFHRGRYAFGSTRSILHVNVVPYETRNPI